MAQLFPSAVKIRGQRYFARGSVRIVRGTPTSLEAVISGSDNYQVKIDWDEGEIALHCSCPYYDSNGPCKHLWAALLAADARGCLTEVQFTRILATDLIDMDEEFESAPPPQKAPAWRTRIAGIGTDKPAPTRFQWPAKRHLAFVFDLNASIATGNLVLNLCTRDRKADGSFARLVSLNLQFGNIPFLPMAEDREILSAVVGGTQHSGYGGYFNSTWSAVPPAYQIRHPLSRTIVPMVVKTGRCYIRTSPAAEDHQLLTWDSGAPWQFSLKLQEKADWNSSWAVSGVLRRDAEVMDVSTPVLITEGGFVFRDGVVAPLAEDTPFEWLMHLRRNGPIDAPAEDRDALLASLVTTPGIPRLELPEDLGFEEVSTEPRPMLKIRSGSRFAANERLTAELFFNYEGHIVSALEKSRGIFDASSHRLIRRDGMAEQSAADYLTGAGVRFRPSNWQQPRSGWELSRAKLAQVVRKLLQANWQLDADGKVFRNPGATHLEVSSGVDWFELHGNVEYGETSAKLPELLEALRRGEEMVKLEDGTFGFIPEAWLQRIGIMAGMGSSEDGHIRFRRSQAGVLDALLATQPQAQVDKDFAIAREELRRFETVKALPQPKGFVGRLRDYQREGVGWMDFLRRFSFGGCLADDMGVGKTAQVLAMLEARRKSRGEKQGPSLVVVPRSLLFNWTQEAQRFTPGLRLLNYTGLNRVAADFSEVDLILTTYGTLRRDAVRLKDVEFDYVILDEAQAIKNASTESAKAARLLRANHRLALSGTPVENHLGELWSLFEFLNPGMLGTASVFKLVTGAGHEIDDETRVLLNRALRPFILRRTKDQVAKELPAKTEQTIYCELEPAQRELYNELRQHYRDTLLRRIESVGLGKSKIMVLEALLRLRQAACHPGLIDLERSAEPAAKLEALLEQLREVLDSGHKALVFSQFTSFLKILRDRLDAEGIVYEYLDGKTRDRQSCVERFQNDPTCPLFLISLKAGGLGLNLTAAEYVFLLDPWWNPAVEAQAVDRAHRIGQTRPVFAYRLIARDTVEEKVLELQKTKRDLAAAIIGEDNALIKNLRREDLELLLS